MNITEIKRAVDCAREAALCNATDASEQSVTVHLSLKEAEEVSESLGQFECLLLGLAEAGAA